jgi:hypothetical protein
MHRIYKKYGGEVMKRLLIIMMCMTLMFTAGCSLLESVNDTVNYVNEATDYVGEATKFAEEVPVLVQQAVNDTNALADLETRLQGMKDEIQEFTSLNPPELAADLHGQIEEQSKIVEAGIDEYLQKIKDGMIDPKILENTQMLDTINDMTNLLDEIKQLGN